MKTFPSTNHLFLPARTGSPNEYAQLEKRFVAGILEQIADWILARGRNSKD